MSWVWCATVIHIAWGVLILISPYSTGSTALSVTTKWTQLPTLQATFLFAIALLSLTGLYIARRPVFKALCIIPQNLLVLATAAAACRAVYLGEYADHVSSHWTSIASDQVIYVAGAAFYVYMVVRIVRE